MRVGFEDNKRGWGERKSRVRGEERGRKRTSRRKKKVLLKFKGEGFFLVRDFNFGSPLGVNQTISSAGHFALKFSVVIHFYSKYYLRTTLLTSPSSWLVLLVSPLTYLPCTDSPVGR